MIDLSTVPICVVDGEKGSPAGISCTYSTAHNSAIIQSFQSKFDIYIVFVLFCTILLAKHKR